MATRQKEPKHLWPRPPREWQAELERRFPGTDSEATGTALRLLNLGRGIAARSAAGFAGLGLTEPRFTVVMMIYRHEWERGFATPSELAREAGTGRAAMSQLIEGLVESGWVERREHEGDRRRIALVLTRSGTRRLERFLPKHRQQLGHAVSRLSRSDRKSLSRLLAKLEASLSAETGLR